MESLFSILLFVAFFYLMMKFGCDGHGHGRHAHGGHHSTNAGEEMRSNTPTGAKTVTRDPVCGMDVEVGRTTDSVEYGGETYYFCSKECVRKFNERPEYFAEIDRMEKRYIA